MSILTLPETLLKKAEENQLRKSPLWIRLRSFDDVRHAALHLEPAGRGSVAVLRGGEQLDIEVTFGGQPGDPLPRSKHVDVVLGHNPGTTSAARAILRSLLTGRDG